MKHSTGGTEFEADEGNLCESTRLALADEKPLDRAQEAHLKKCAFCQKFQNETEILKKDLAALDMDPLVKNGVSLADAVMEEVGKQAAFRVKPSASPKHRLFRHAGLAAACLVVFVLAAPTVFNTMHAQKKFDALPNEAALPQTMFSAGNTDEPEDGVTSSKFAVSDENACLTDKGANNKAFSNAADTVFPDESTEEETKVPLLTVQAPATDGMDEPAETQKSSDVQSGGTNAANAPSNDDSLTIENTNNAYGQLFMLKPNSENATSDVSSDTTSETVSNGFSPENGAENSTDGDNSAANGIDCILPPNTTENNETDTVSKEISDTSSAQGGGGGGSGGSAGGGGSANGGGSGSQFSSSLSYAPETDGASDSFDSDESDHLDDRSNTGAPSLVETAYEAAIAHFGTRYAISIDNASVTMLSENRLYVDFSVEATTVHLQVFMTFTDGEWRISSDADGNVQIFEVTALYNYVG